MKRRDVRRPGPGPTRGFLGDPERYLRAALGD